MEDILSPVKYHYFHRLLAYSVRRELNLYQGYLILVLSVATRWPHDSSRRQCQIGSLTGAVHLSNDNAGVLRLAQRGRKPLVE